MSWIELMKYDAAKEEFYVERQGTGNSRLKERYPLSHWNLVKEVTVFVHVERTINTESLEFPEKILHYKVPLTYKVIDEALGKTIYLKIEKQAFDTTENDLRKDWIKVYMRDVDAGQTQEVPLPNLLFSQEAFPFLKIQRGESKQLAKKEVIELYQSGLCIGKFDSRMENRL
jgi:hypothetical protein